MRRIEGIEQRNKDSQIALRTCAREESRSRLCVKIENEEKKRKSVFAPFVCAVYV